MTSKRTFCRICEAHCGLRVDLDDAGEITAVRPDDEHPVSRGYACVKGLGLGALHRDPDRLNQPHKRVGDRFEPIGWTQAIAEIGARVRQLRADHGPRSIALYTGNPTFFSFANVMYSAAFLEALHSPNLFASHSIDANNKFHVATSMYGRSIVHPVPDLRHAQFFLCMGSNPVVSQMSLIQVVDPLARLRAIEGRGGRVVIVDPRRSETAQKVGEHVAIRPGTDAYFLLAMLHVLTREGPGLDEAVREPVERAREVATGVDAVIAAARPWTPERVAAITGIDAATIRELARAYARAEGAVLYMSTGVNMGPFGSIAYWLVQALNLLTGNIDRRGGLLVPRGAFDTLQLAQWLGLGGADEHRTLVAGHHRVAGCFPVAALADEITCDHPERIRALFVSAGNPVHSMPGGARLARAMEELELVVSIDIYRNETAAHAHYLLPATDMLERSDFPASHANLQETPHAQYTDAVVPPRHERRPEWQIFSELAVACGAPPLGKSVCNLLPRLNRVLARIPGLGPITPDHLLALLLRWGGQVTLGELRRHPEGVLLPETQPGSFLGQRVPTPDGLVQLAPPEILADLPRLAERESDFLADDGRLALIGRRERRSHNSWMHNNPHIRQPDGNQALLHPEDAAARDIADGDEIDISSGEGPAIRLRARLTTDVRPGVIAVPHGWGHHGAGLSRAAALPGDNINAVIPGGLAHIEPVSGQAIMLAHRVQVRAAREPAV